MIGEITVLIIDAQDFYWISLLKISLKIYFFQNQNQVKKLFESSRLKCLLEK